jgi:hypothetical protein
MPEAFHRIDIELSAAQRGSNTAWDVQSDQRLRAWNRKTVLD